jgi:hypothetical protein
VVQWLQSQRGARSWGVQDGPGFLVSPQLALPFSPERRQEGGRQVIFLFSPLLSPSSPCLMDGTDGVTTNGFPQNPRN